MLNVILLAAGQGLRMGGPNKLLLPFRNSTVLATTLEQLCAAQIGSIYVVTGHQRELVAPVLAGFPVQEVYNPAYMTGMTTSIQAGVQATLHEWPYMICLGDMPMITTAAYKLLAASFLHFSADDPRAILLPRFGENKGNPVIFANAYRETILSHSDPEGCRGVVQAQTIHVRWTDMPDDAVLRDLDTPEDYRQLQKPGVEYSS